jgi:anti-anti-sigma factor
MTDQLKGNVERLSMKINVHNEEKYTLVEVEGSLSVESLNYFEKKLQGAYERGLNIIIDFSSLVFIDSSSLGLILVYFTKQTGNKKHLVLMKVNRDIYEMFNITGLSRRVKIFDSLDTALAHIEG